jgi:hypothetical protein
MIEAPPERDERFHFLPWLRGIVTKINAICPTCGSVRIRWEGKWRCLNLHGGPSPAQSHMKAENKNYARAVQSDSWIEFKIAIDKSFVHCALCKQRCNYHNSDVRWTCSNNCPCEPILTYAPELEDLAWLKQHHLQQGRVEE